MDFACFARWARRLAYSARRILRASSAIFIYGMKFINIYLCMLFHKIFYNHNNGIHNSVNLTSVSGNILFSFKLFINNTKHNS